MLEHGSRRAIPDAIFHVACLVFCFAASDVEDQDVRWRFLIFEQLYNTSNLHVFPSLDFEILLPVLELRDFDRLVVDFFLSLSLSAVNNVVQDSLS